MKKLFLAATLMLGFSSLVLAVNLTVSGITNPSAANGTYIPCTSPSTINGKNVWVKQTGGYYIYNDIYQSANPDSPYWNIDVDLEDQNANDVLFYSNNNSDAASPISVTSWGAGFSPIGPTGSPVVVEETATPVPEIKISGNSYEITDGSTFTSFTTHTNFGSVNVSAGTMARTYTVANLGAGTLTISGVTITGANSGDFSVTSAPAGSVASSGSTTFVITFNPSSTGSRNATVTVSNNDSNEGSYDFSINGYGFTPGDLQVTGITNPTAANTVYVHQGVMNNFEYWQSSNGYYVYTDGSNWLIDNDTVSSAVLFFSSTLPYSVLDVASWTLEGTATGTPVVTASDPNPNINVKGNGVNIVTGDVSPAYSDFTKFGSVNIASSSASRTFTIENTGSAALTISGVSFTGTDASSFSVTSAPASTVAAMASTTFTVAFDPSATGVKSAVINISNNDSDENPYTFTVSGDAFTPINLIVSGITGTYTASNGEYAHLGLLNGFQYWKHISQNFYIYNHIFENGYYWNIDTDTNDNTQLFYSNGNGEVYTPTEVASWGAVDGAGTPSLVYKAPSSAAEPTVAYSADQAVISWTASAGAVSYKVYSSADPYAAFPSGWNLETTVAGLTWTDASAGASVKKFYVVVAVN
ncbi:MAG: choice-of-anchor D domain-containing protein [Candidatus Delongbacteria bacterium]|nr:choice-of-anchor D domain-containing protein [Candidatus Delongbacteria bacterium]